MKMHLKSMLLLMGVSFIIFTGFKNADVRGAQDLKANINHSPVTFTCIYTDGALPTVTGTFTTSGEIETSGTTTMTVNKFANVFHCSQTLVAPGGTITVLSNCQSSTMTGSWRIINGTGDYANLQGNGRLKMTFPAGVIVIETFSGKIF
jgi:hypothetical protein